MLCGVLWASQAEYYLKALGMKVAYLKININDRNQTMDIHTHSLFTSSIFPQLDNTYSITFDNEYRPLNLKRDIHQKSLDDVVTTDYDRTKLTARLCRQSEPKSRSYPIGKDTREVFTFLAFLAKGNPRDGSYEIDGNGSKWKAVVARKGSETVKTILGKQPAQRYEIRFASPDQQKAPYIDMATNNILNQNSRISVWVDAKQRMIKAVVKARGISTNWELIGYKA